MQGLTITGGHLTAGPGGAGINDAANLSISNCTITNNDAHFLNGAGILHTAGTLVIVDSTISANTTDGLTGSGGGVYTANGPLEISNSTFSTNASNNGAGIYAMSGNVVIRNSTFALNDAGAALGGGIENNGATLAIDATTFSANNASAGGGGGIYNLTGNDTVTRSTFTGNSARRGGGINVQGGFVTVTNSTFDSNTASVGFGSAIDQEGGTVRLIASTVARNTSFGAALASAGKFLVGNSIVAQNSAGPGTSPDVSGTFTDLGYNLIGINTGSTSFTASTDQVGTTATPINPLLGTLASNGGPTQTDALLTSSPAIDAGNPALGLPTDQRGITRPQGAAPDIGAYERQSKLNIPKFNVVLIPLFFDKRDIGVVALGTIQNLGPFGTASFTINDANGNIIQKGDLATDSRGDFLFTGLLPAVQDGVSLAGQQFTFTITASNPDDSTTSSTTITIPGKAPQTTA
jgi:predicted outer membrane repeat protein